MWHQIWGRCRRQSPKAPEPSSRPPPGGVRGQPREHMTWGQREENKPDRPGRPTKHHNEDKNTEDHRRRGEFKNWRRKGSEKRQLEGWGGTTRSRAGETTATRRPQEGPGMERSSCWNEGEGQDSAPAGARTSAAPGGSLKSLKDKLMTHVPVGVLMAVAREKGDRASRVSWVVRADTQIPKSFTHGAPSREKAVASDQKSATNELDSFLLPQGYDLREMWC